VTRKTPAKPAFVLHGDVVEVFADSGTVVLDHNEVPGLMSAMRGKEKMEFAVARQEELKDLKPGEAITAGVRRQGRDYVLENIRPAAGGSAAKRP
jgi:Cu/Ag efflux protein CusF